MIKLVAAGLLAACSSSPAVVRPAVPPSNVADSSADQDAPSEIDLDADGDRILLGCDRCPNEPETFQGCDDLDGCPDNSGACHRYRSDNPASFGQPEATPLNSGCVDGVPPP